MFSPPPNENKQKRSIGYRIAVLSFFLLFCAAAALPTFLSTKKGTRLFCDLLSRRLDAEVEIDFISLSWLAGQELKGLRLSFAPKGLRISLAKASSDASLLSILFRRNLGDTSIETPHITLIKKELSFAKQPKALLLQKSSLFFIPEFSEAMKKALFPIKGNISWREGRIDLQSHPDVPLSLYDLKGSAFLAEDGSIISVYTNASSLLGGNEGSLEVDCTLKRIDTLNPDLMVNAKINDLPVQLIDTSLSLFFPQLHGVVLKTVGQSLSLSLSLQLSQLHADAQLKASSTNIVFDLSTTTTDKQIQLSKECRFEAMLPHDLFSLSNLFSSRSEGQIKVSGLIESLTVPISELGISFEKLAIHSQLTLSPVDSDLGPCRLFIDSPSLNDKIILKAIASLDKNHAEAVGKGEVQILGLLDQDTKVIASAQMTKLPAHLIDGWVQSSLPSTIIGDDLDGSLALTLSKDAAELQCRFSSSLFSLPDLVIKKQADGYEALPFTCSLTLTEALYQRLSVDSAMIGAAPSFWKIYIDRLELPRLQGIEDLVASASITCPELSFDKFFKRDPLAIQNIEAKLAVASLDAITFAIDSNLFSFTAAAAYDAATSLLRFKGQQEGKWIVTPPFLQSIAPGDLPPSLKDPFAVRFSLQPFSIHLSDAIVPQLKIQAELNCDPFTLQDHQGVDLFTLAQAQVSLDVDGAGAGAASLRSRLALQGSNSSSAPLAIAIECQNFINQGDLDLNNASFHIDGELKKVPAKAFAPFFSDVDIEKITGRYLSLSALFDKKGEDASLSFNGQSDYIRANASFALKDHVLRLQGDRARIELTLTDHLMKLFSEDPIERVKLLSQDAIIKCEIVQMSIPIPQRMDDLYSSLASLGFSAKISSSDLRIAKEDRSAEISIKDISVAADKQSFSQKASMQISCRASSLPSLGVHNEGGVKAQVIISEFLPIKGASSPSFPSLDVDLNIQKLPSYVLDLIAQLGGLKASPFSPLFGPYVSATLAIHAKELSGPISFHCLSPHTQAFFSGQIQKGILTLSEPLHAQVVMTEPLSRFIIEQSNPLSLSEVRASAPLTIEIAAEGFSFPLFPFALDKVNIASARLELGKIFCANKGNLQEALGLLKSNQLMQDRYLNLWFTPIDFHIKGGVIDVERTDILIAELLNICLWGNVNPLTNRVDMILGLTAQCLMKAFGLRQIPSDYVLHIPLTGTLQDVKINSGKATAKIAALLAWQTAGKAGSKAAGPAGDLLGQFMNKIGTLPLNDSDTPKAKRPFPWEEGQNMKKEQKGAKKKRAHLKHSDKPLKQLWKVIR